MPTKTAEELIQDAVFSLLEEAAEDLSVDTRTPKVLRTYPAKAPSSKGLPLIVVLLPARGGSTNWGTTYERVEMRFAVKVIDGIRTTDDQALVDRKRAALFAQKVEGFLRTCNETWNLGYLHLHVYQCEFSRTEPVIYGNNLMEQSIEITSYVTIEKGAVFTS